LLALACTSLPIALSTSTINTVPTEGNPAFWLITRLALIVGLPFFVLATTGPLLQHWFAATRHTHARDPYFLYAASNAGSLIALIAYLALLEPRFTLPRQSRLWTIGYALLIALMIFCVLALARSRNEQAADDDQTATDQAQITNNQEQITTNTQPLSFRRRLRWLALAFVPSSLMLGVTTFISTDIASLPLLWVIPLALYLLTLILAFARRQIFSTRLLAFIMPGVTLLLVLVYLSGAAQPFA